MEAMMAKNNTKEVKDKTKKSLHRLSAINHEVEKINDQLSEAAKKISNIVADKDKILKDFKLKSYPEKSQKKQRAMIYGTPKRIEFGFINLKFYIDLTVVASEGDDLANIKGWIVYGTSRTLCFSECIFPNGSTDDECKNCQRIKRCDALEDKPLLCFSVTQHGMIQSSGELEGEWWIEDKSNLLELHYRALDLIWKQALDWSNENILP